MPSSTLDPEFQPEPDRQQGIGHGTDALGPSDLSDTGSDVQGGYQAVDDGDLGLDRGTNEDADTRALPAGDDTSDSGKTGEDTTTGRSGDVIMDGDIGFDRIESIADEPDGDIDPENDPDAAPYADPALEAVADVEYVAAGDLDAAGNALSQADPDAEIAALADGDAVDDDDETPGEKPLFDKVTRTDERSAAPRSH